MPGTIEEFVAKLQADGVQAGRQAAEDITAKAGKQAQQMIADAGEQARKIVDEAQAQADSIRARSQTQLDLACRDAILRLQQALNDVLTRAMKNQSASALADGELLGRIIHDMILLCVKPAQAAQDRGTAGRGSAADDLNAIKLNTQSQLRDKVTQWVNQALSQTQSGGLAVEIKTELTGAGFELKARGEKYEISVESVAELLAGMVGDELAGRVRTQAGGGREAS
ncbi:MAG: hypothetical protein HZA50_06030 [Planctomycetes bacterium]|nr:hypothetical protein [Planctomycetota bacterium]